MDNMAKITVTIKDPDTLIDAIEDAVKLEVKTLNLPAYEANLLIAARKEKTIAAMCKWWKYSEYITMEFDMEAMTARIIERDK